MINIFFYIKSNVSVRQKVWMKVTKKELNDLCFSCMINADLTVVLRC